MSDQIKSPRKYLYSHISQETAYLVEDYPWGFRLRTSIRYWIESKNTKNGGQRFGSQTINPKTGRWCAPKYSTYSPIMVMFLDENNHVRYQSLGMNCTEEYILKFKETHIDNLSDFQKNNLKEIIAFEAVMRNVTFTIRPSKIGPVSLLSNNPDEIKKRELMRKECEDREKEQSEIMGKISMAIAYETKKVVL